MKNIALAGAGYWGKNLVRNFYELGALKTICDKHPDIQSQYEEKYPGLTYTKDFQSLLDDNSIEALVIATPAETTTHLCAVPF